MINQKHLGYFIQECRRFGVRILAGPQKFDIGSDTADGEVVGMNSEYLPSMNFYDFISAVGRAFENTRRHFGLAPRQVNCQGYISIGDDGVKVSPGGKSN